MTVVLLYTEKLVQFAVPNEDHEPEDDSTPPTLVESQPRWVLYGPCADVDAAKAVAKQQTAYGGDHQTNRFAIVELPDDKDEDGLPDGAEIFKGTPPETPTASLRKA